jgi:phosphatidylglycerophosphate synthase
MLIDPIRTENRDLTYRCLSPLYRRIAAKIPQSVSPNWLTLLGFCCAVAVAALLLAWRDPSACIVAGVFVLLSGMFDCIDGIHARNTGRSTLFGAYLDAAADAVMAGIIYPALIVRYKLYAPIYIFTACFRPVVACLIHACTAETGVRIDPEFGSVSENVTIAIVLLAAGSFPGAIDLFGTATPNSWLANFLIAQKLETLTIPKAALLFAAVALPITAIRGVIEARKLLVALDLGKRESLSNESDPTGSADRS